MSKCQVAVLGAGVIGLSSALCIQESCPNVEVTIVAELFSSNTTSYGAGGFWLPVYISGADSDLVREAGISTYDKLKFLANSSEAQIAGCQQLSGYSLDPEITEGNKEIMDIVDGYRKLPENELSLYPGIRSGYSFVTYVVNMPAYLEWMMRRFKSRGGHVQCRKVNSLAELSDQFEVVVNCCGIGARELLGDLEIEPIRGQVMQVEAPWIKHFYFIRLLGDNNYTYSYVLPQPNYLVVGGSSQKGDWNCEVDEKDDDKIWNTAIHYLPQLSTGKRLKSWAGLRPVRSKMRLEVETKTIGSKSLEIVHNYGHGGSGITLHWGLAQKATSMLQEILKKKGDARTPALKHKL